MLATSEISSTTILRLAGISYRQLDYWCSEGLIRGGNPGSGMARAFDYTDLKVAKVLARLREIGFCKSAFRVAADSLYFLDDMGRLSNNGDAIMFSPDGRIILEDEIPKGRVVIVVPSN